MPDPTADARPIAITMRLNQQQLELLDRMVARDLAPDRVSLVRLALRESAADMSAASRTPER